MENEEVTMSGDVRPWIDAIQAVLDGTADAATKARLGAALRDDPALRRAYREQVAAEMDLRVSDPELRDRLAPLLAPKPHRVLRLPRFALALAATLLVCVVIAATTAVVVSSSATSEGSATAPAIRATASEGSAKVSTIRAAASKSSASAFEGSAKASLPSAAVTQATSQSATSHQPPATSQSATSYQPPATSQSATSYQPPATSQSVVTSAAAGLPVVAYWPFGSDTVNDTTGNGHALTASGVTFGGDGAATLNGAQTAFNTASALDLGICTTGVTFECFVKTTQTTLGFLFEHSANQNTTAGTFYFDVNETSGSKLAGFLLNLTASTPTASSGRKGLNSTTKVCDGAWHHLAAVYDPSDNSWKCYVDRVLQSSATMTTTGALRSDTLYIGSRANTTLKLTGEIDDIRITAAALGTADFLQARTGLPSPSIDEATATASTSASMTNITLVSTTGYLGANASSAQFYAVASTNADFSDPVFSGAFGDEVTSAPATRTTVFENLKGDTTYYFRVSLTNSAGYGAATRLSATTHGPGTAYWTYYPAGATLPDGTIYGTGTNVLADGNWVLRVGVLNASDHTLQLTKYLAGAGECNLGPDSVITDAGGNFYTITATGAAAFSGNATITGMVFPATLVSFSGNNHCFFDGCKTLRRVVLHAPGLTKIGSYNFRNCTALAEADFDLPSLATNDYSAFVGCSALVADIATVCPPTVTCLGGNAFNGCSKLYGELVLTNLASLGGADFSGCGGLTSARLASATLTSIPGLSFFNCTSLSNVVLDAPCVTRMNDRCFYACPITNNWRDVIPTGVQVFESGAFTYGHIKGDLVLTNCVLVNATSLSGNDLTSVSFLSTNPVSIYTYKTHVGAFCNCPNLGTVVFGSAAPSYIAYDVSNLTDFPFYNCPLTNVTFYGAAPTNTEQIGYGILRSIAGTATSTDHACTIYCSKRQPGWSELAAPFLNDEERANAPAGCFGVYTNSMGWRLAWMVHRKSPYDGAGGFVIRICDNNVIVPYNWISNNLAKADCASNTAISNALVSTGANGLKRWESYALGLKPDNPSSVVLCDMWQDGDARTATFCARNVAPNTNENLSVQYVLEGSPDGRAWSYSLVSATNAISLSLPAVYSFFRVRADILIQ